MITTARRLASVVRVACALFAVACSPRSPTPIVGTTPPAGDGTLSWSDEFDGAAGAPVDAAKWTHEVNGDGGGNNERQYYTAGTANAALDGAGHLVITARALPDTTSLTCWYGRCRYASARMVTKGKFAQTYGRFEARIRIPRGQGIWPAFWMLGTDIDAVGWPASGEIDIMENIGREPGTVHGTLHAPGLDLGAPTELSSGTWADDFHVYGAEWDANAIAFSVDGREYRRIARTETPAGGTWAFDHPFFLILNLAVGGNWPGDPDATSTFPQTMTVDWVRAYRR